MLFNSWTFAAFLALVLPVYYGLSHRRQNGFLLAASYVFYGAWDWRFLALLWISTGVDFAVGRALARDGDERRRRLLLSASLAVNLGILGAFKYAGFFVGSAQRLLESAGLAPNLPILELVLPVGISFYTFQTLSYTIDVYRGRLEPTPRLLDFALFVAWFPQLVAGPIERASRLLPQITSPRTVADEQWSSGLQLLLWGYLKKVVVADGLARYVDRAFALPEEATPIALWLGVYAFALQIYCDFSGYTDIARGVSRLFGIELMENFRQPYLSRNIAEFWRRWHVSLSTWLRDYLYIPLGGNRRGERRRYANLAITMLLGGLWHGASWTFVAWGGLHGLALAGHRLWRGTRGVGEPPAPDGAAAWVRQLAAGLLTFHFVALLWVFFRAEDFADAATYLRGLFDWTRLGLGVRPVPLLGLPGVVACFGALILALDARCRARGSELPFDGREGAWLRGLAYGAALILLAFVRSSDLAPFIYFQF